MNYTIFCMNAQYISHETVLCMLCTELEEKLTYRCHTGTVRPIPVIIGKIGPTTSLERCSESATIVKGKVMFGSGLIIILYY